MRHVPPGSDTSLQWLPGAELRPDLSIYGRRSVSLETLVVDPICSTGVLDYG